MSTQETTTKKASELRPGDIVPGMVIDLTCFVQMFDFGGVTLSVFKHKDYVQLGEHRFQFTVPADFNAVAQSVQAIDSQINTLVDEHLVKLHRLKERKNQLLQISYGGNDILDAEPEGS